MNDVHSLDVVFAEKRGPLIGTLAAANDQHSLFSNLVKSNKVARVQAQARGERCSPFRKVSEVSVTRRRDDSFSADLRSVVK